MFHIYSGSKVEKYFSSDYETPTSFISLVTRLWHKTSRIRSARNGDGFDALPWFFYQMLGPNHIITKDVKFHTYYCYVRCATLIVQVGGLPSLKRGKLITMHNQDSLARVANSKGLLSAMQYGQDLGSIGWVFGPLQGGFAPLLWSGWPSSLITATPHRYMQIQYKISVC